MQSPPAPSYTYDALGRIVMAAPSGGSNDVLAATAAIAVLPNAASVTVNTNGLLHETVLNAPQLFTPAVSITNPPIRLVPAVSQASPGTMIANSRPFLAPPESS